MSRCSFLPLWWGVRTVTSSVLPGFDLDSRSFIPETRISPLVDLCRRGCVLGLIVMEANQVDGGDVITTLLLGEPW